MFFIPEQSTKSYRSRLRTPVWDLQSVPEPHQAARTISSCCATAVHEIPVLGLGSKHCLRINCLMLLGGSEIWGIILNIPIYRGFSFFFRLVKRLSHPWNSVQDEMLKNSNFTLVWILCKYSILYRLGQLHQNLYLRPSKYIYKCFVCAHACEWACLQISLV